MRVRSAGSKIIWIGMGTVVCLVTLFSILIIIDSDTADEELYSTEAPSSPVDKVVSDVIIDPKSSKPEVQSLKSSRTESRNKESKPISKEELILETLTRPQTKSRNGDSRPIKQKKAIFWEICEANFQSAEKSDKDPVHVGKLNASSLDKIRSKYNMSKAELNNIKLEGFMNNWPKPNK